jgi:hypothetical protein
MRVAILLLLAVLAGCFANNVPDVASRNKALDEALLEVRNARSMELISLDPMERVHGDDSEAFHDWTVLGKTTITNPDIREQLLDALDAGIAGNNGVAASCFAPRHGVRVRHDGKEFDFVICFQCYQTEWYVDGMKRPGFLLTALPQPVFDRVLRDAGVPLPAPAVR